MSAEIIQFVREPKRHGGHSDFPTIVFRSEARLDDLVMDQSEDVRPEPGGSDDA